MATAYHQKVGLPSSKLLWLLHAMALVILLTAALVKYLQVVPRGWDPHVCQRVTSNFNVTAVLEGLDQQSALAAAAAAANGSFHQRLHIITVISSHTSVEKVKSSPLIRGLPPAMRPMVKVIKAQGLIAHGPAGFGAFGAKIIELYKFVNQSSVAPADLVLLTDAFDIVLNHSMVEELPARFAAVTSSGSNSRGSCSSVMTDSSSSHSSAGSVSGTSSSCQKKLAVVFAAEKFCWPDQFRFSCYPPTQTAYQFLNAGVLIGHAGYIKALLQPFIHQISTWMDDQRWYTTAYLALGESRGFFLDSNCVIFQTLPRVEVDGQELWFDDSRRKWYNVVTKTYPVLLHGNGPGRKQFFAKVVPRLAAWWDWENKSDGGKS